MSALDKALKHYLEQGYRSFHTPGHKGKREFFADWDFPGWDLTELPGLDRLHCAEGVVARAQRRVAEIFGAEESYFLVNGATVGNQAMFLALAEPRGKVLIQRQAHRSVMSALVLSGQMPEYLPGVVHPDFNLPLGVDCQGGLSCLRGTSVWHFTYPSYFGTTMDLGFFLQERERNFPDLPVLVDQAHGAHYVHDFFPASALKLGADLVLHSSHKTLSALTQAALLHVQGQRVSRSRVRQALELLETSSPSYLLMASLARAAEFARVRERWLRLREEVDSLRRRVRGLRLLTAADAGSYGIEEVDWSKILVNTRPIGLRAAECVEILRREYHIEPELWDEENILFVLGIGNSPDEVRALSIGLQALVRRAAAGGFKTAARAELTDPLLFLPPYPPQRCSPRDAFLAPKRQVHLRDALGRISAESVSPYPPGIPLIVMGEEITPPVLEVLERPDIHWQGWEDFAGKKIWVLDGV
ncbi:Pyridoxal phosphate-dependent transferase, major region, subdomain 1 [Acididesulfobacillus acetoxydans]|uniref:Arginine decarboxylase n=1 Tax=Acididesulfobacillus acetoxydans TaxID=1561005 RepID=A0A8S0Y1R9_9FIRM|nr:amino acid decarboxylase [Acididesulfobacillus acetoxydans]CAA7599865.1 Pyridoxal phosphate-dependent transferase, major region, subdomain 1 [Acididesulfobacillus acetoxydans]CEJ07431.1 Arginine decarboxylase [Acididesulfobacillus acetoxydans]